MYLEEWIWVGCNRPKHWGMFHPTSVCDTSYEESVFSRDQILFLHVKELLVKACSNILHPLLRSPVEHFKFLQVPNFFPDCFESIIEV